ncbi:DEAD/DEAH box helicase [Parachryseolinea silvisoli]|uniref:DEAD/DEAH box helicase n=1 Tax=Parachryseolinea silvisoli TaxID=2873601 RepID=UPI002265C5F4|nr:DEAD/DEAH box helicase [Parachryseolinea silvisoli]MCD9018876.1 DEAD/DEAH box helicase [Parachryseolinea silvisoli]
MQSTAKAAQADYLKNIGIETLNPMQEETIAKAAVSPNLMLLAPTGSGKTLAFLLPVIQALKPEKDEVQALIIVPSRELALQIEQVFRNLKTNYKVSCFYGGHAMKIEESSLSTPPAVIIGTPGRLADHILRKTFDTRTIRWVVLDEFDKSLQMGFEPQLAVVFKSLTGKQRHLLTSATSLDIMPSFIPFSQPERISYLNDTAPTRLKLKSVHTLSTEKVETLMRLVAGFNQEVCLVFCNHREAVDRISALFTKHNFAHGILHGALEQIDREKNLIKFRAGAHNVLIATDLASRGLDIPEIKHVVHYQLPQQRDAFIHRNGRTARMHAEGEAYFVLAEDEIVPPYMDDEIIEIKVNPKLVLPPPPEFVCLYISAGRKDKVSKGDIAGLLMKKGGLTADQIGLITTLDYTSFVAIRRTHLKQALSGIKNEKLKNLKVKIEEAS